MNEKMTPFGTVNDHYVGFRVGTPTPDALAIDSDGYGNVRENEWVGTPLPDALAPTAPQITSLTWSNATGEFTIKHRVRGGVYKLIFKGKTIATGTDGTFKYKALEPYTNHGFIVENEVGLQSELRILTSQKVDLAPHDILVTGATNSSATLNVINHSYVNLHVAKYYLPITLRVMRGSSVLKEYSINNLSETKREVTGLMADSAFNAVAFYNGCNDKKEITFRTLPEEESPVIPPAEGKEKGDK